MTRRVSLVLSIVIFTFTLCTQAYGLKKVHDVIPDKLPVRSQLHLAMQALYGIEAHYGDQIISGSEFLSKDSALKKHHALWKAASELCLKEPSKCAILNLPLELIYGDTLRQKKILTSDATRFPSNAYALAAILAEEKLILKQLTAQNAYGKLVASSMGGGKSMTCYQAAVATGGGAQCEALNILQEGINPAASGDGDTFGKPLVAMGAEQFDHSPFATCPINAHMVGGFGGGDDPEGDPPGDDTPPPDDSGDDSGDDNGDDNNNDNNNNDDNNNDNNNNDDNNDNGNNNGSGEGSGGTIAAGNGDINLPGGLVFDPKTKTLKIPELPGEYGPLPDVESPTGGEQPSPFNENPKTYTFGVTFKFRPTDDSPGFGSICGGVKGALAFCFLGGSDSNLNDSLEDCMAGPIECSKGNMDDFTIVASSADCAEFLWGNGGTINPGPFGGEGDPPSEDDDNCINPYGSSANLKCCKKNPSAPGCGPGPAHLGNTAISTPVSSAWKQTIKAAPRGKIY